MGIITPLGRVEVSAFKREISTSILSTNRRVVKSANPIPHAFPPLSSVRSRTKIRVILGFSSMPRCKAQLFRPITLLSIPDPLMFFPISSTISTSISSNGSRSISRLASRSSALSNAINPSGPAARMQAV